MSYPKRDHITKVALSVILYATACSCAPMNRVPMVGRPDTRWIMGTIVDSTALHGTMDILAAAFPNEGAVCYGGELRDTVADLWVLHLTSVHPARSDSVNFYHVYFHGDGPLLPCEHPIAVGHSHPYAVAECDHSDDDVRLLFARKPALVSVVWCGNGEFQVLYQDGRRQLGRWRP